MKLIYENSDDRIEFDEDWDERPIKKPIWVTFKDSNGSYISYVIEDNYDWSVAVQRLMPTYGDTESKMIDMLNRKYGTVHIPLIGDIPAGEVISEFWGGCMSEDYMSIERMVFAEELEKLYNNIDNGNGSFVHYDAEYAYEPKGIVDDPRKYSKRFG